MTAPMPLEDAYAVLAGTKPRIKRIPVEHRALTRLRDHIAQLERETVHPRIDSMELAHLRNILAATRRFVFADGDDDPDETAAELEVAYNGWANWHNHNRREEP